MCALLFYFKWKRRGFRFVAMLLILPEVEIFFCMLYGMMQHVFNDFVRLECFSPVINHFQYVTRCSDFFSVCKIFLVLLSNSAGRESIFFYKQCTYTLKFWLLHNFRRTSTLFKEFPTTL